MQASVLLLHGGSYRWAQNLWVLIIYLFVLPVMLSSEVPRLTTDSPGRVFPGVWKLLSFLRLPSWDGSLSLPLLSLFLSFIFFPTSFRMGCFSGCLMFSAGIQKLILWNLLSVQMFFQWICGAESGLPILFLCHLRTAPLSILCSFLNVFQLLILSSHIKWDLNCFCSNIWTQLTQIKLTYSGQKNMM